MSFPHHDGAWVGAADFVAAHRRPDESLLAPDAFFRRFDRIYRYANTRLRPDAGYDWAVLHKTMLHDLDRRFLATVDRVLRPVFANEAFVVFARNPALGRLGMFDRNLAAFRRNRRRLRRNDPRYERGISHVLVEPGHPDDGILVKFPLLSQRELKAAMDRFFVKGGYQYITHRDQEYTRALDRQTRALMGDTAELRILDLCCGTGRVAALVGECAELVSVDLAEQPLPALSRQWAGKSNYRFAVMAADRLALPDGRFDLVTIINSAEHVPDFAAVLGEVDRVLRPGGRLVLSAQNADSLHLILSRKLGYPSFVTNYQHFQEWTVAEMTELLSAKGLTVERSVGVSCYPYWEVPGVDQFVRRVTDGDPEFAAIMGILGERIGPEYAYTFILGARKSG